MFKHIKHLLTQPAEPPVTVTALKHASFLAADGSPIGSTPGECYIVTPKTAKALVFGGVAEIVGQADADAKRLAELDAMLPKPAPTNPPPDGWSELPPCFCQWWEFADKREALTKRHQAIEKRLMCTLNINVGGPGGVMLTPKSDALERADVLSLLARQAVGNTIVLEDDRLARSHISDALRRAAQALVDWDAQYAGQTEELYLLCSDHVISAHAELSRISWQCRQAAIDLFSLRVGALLLAPWQIERLFHGSRDFVTYYLPAADVTLHDRRRLTAGRCYIDTVVPTMVYLLKKYRNDTARVERLLTEAKAELKRAQKATAAAA